MTVHRDWKYLHADAVDSGQIVETDAVRLLNDTLTDSHNALPPAKRMFDIVLSAVLLLLLSGLMAAVALILLVVQGRPILYRAERAYRPGKTFVQFKFRTMLQQQDDTGATGAHKHWRITPVGRFLRRNRIDELPQLFNILRGEMSFVGPRPPLMEYVERFPGLYRQVLQCRPGVTGLATLIYHRHEDRILANCSSAEATESAYYRRCLPAKMRIDQIYLRQRTMSLDLWIIWQTLKIVVLKRDERPKRRGRG